MVFSYGVEWRKSEVHWASRWDIYLTMNGAVPDKVHWFSIVNSILIVLFLAFMVAMILIRALNRDISKYNRVSSVYYVVVGAVAFVPVIGAFRMLYLCGCSRASLVSATVLCVQLAASTRTVLAFIHHTHMTNIHIFPMHSCPRTRRRLRRGRRAAGSSCTPTCSAPRRTGPCSSACWPARACR